MNKILNKGITLLGFSLLSLSAMSQNRPISSFDRPIARPEPPRSENTKIQVAILLDVSGSMDGLIEQAKSRIWNIVNTLTTLRFGGKTPVIEIALFQYGMGSNASNGYIQQLAPLTTDLDLISEKLFSLRTSGSEEFCGQVIRNAARDLAWSNKSSDIKLIYIAGNEPFNQGSVSYQSALNLSKAKGISTSTIYCGDFNEGVNGFWRTGATLGNGKYFNINSNEQVQFVETPYDDQIDEYNKKLNDTYISYGRQGNEKKSNQARQDVQAESLSKANKAERSVSKSKAAYTNSNWDLVDLAKDNPAALQTVDKNYLPDELKGKSDAEIKKVVVAKQAERASYQKKISDLGRERQAFIDKKTKETSSSSADDLGTAINQSIVDLAKKKGYTVVK